MPDTATRFAEISLNLFRREGTFRIEVPADDDFELTATAFEARGCAVERDRDRRCLVVDCRPG